MTNVKSAGPGTENRVITEEVRFRDEKQVPSFVFSPGSGTAPVSEILQISCRNKPLCARVDRSDLLIYGGIKIR